MAQVKNATLESETVFFDRLEKQNKIEDARKQLTEAMQGLRHAMRYLSPAGVEQLDSADQEIERAMDPLESAARSIGWARSLLRMYHEGTSPQAVAIAMGRIDAVSLVSRLRRCIKAAERSLRSVSRDLAEGQKRIDLAPGKLIDSLPGDDPRRPKIQEDAKKKIETASASLADASSQTNVLVSQLEGIRRDIFPECPPSAGPDRCQVASLDMLKQSTRAIELLDAASAKASDIKCTLDRVQELRMAAIEFLEEADAIVHPAYGKARLLEAQAEELLDRADGQLLEIKRGLTSETPGEVKCCSHCGREFIRTWKVQDPACACAKSNAAMLDAEETVKKAQGLAEQLTKLLEEVPEKAAPPSPLSVAIKELRNEQGVLHQLALSLTRGEEFRQQQFDFFPGESVPPDAEEIPKRAFPPMVAYYVARESWHYPLYFQDLSLERYGHNFGCAQTPISYGKFLADLAMLPYNAWLEPPWKVQYDQGLYRPGDEVPHLIYLPRPDLGAASFEAGVWTGLMFLP